MTTTVIAPKALENDASASVPSVRNRWSNQSDNQMFSKTFADSLKQHNHNVSGAQDKHHESSASSSARQVQRPNNAKDNSNGVCQDKVRCQTAKGEGRHLPSDGKNLHDKTHNDEVHSGPKDTNAAGQSPTSDNLTIASVQNDPAQVERPNTNSGYSAVPDAATATQVQTGESNNLSVIGAASNNAASWVNDTNSATSRSNSNPTTTSDAALISGTAMRSTNSTTPASSQTTNPGKGGVLNSSVTTTLVQSSTQATSGEVTDAGQAVVNAAQNNSGAVVDKNPVLASTANVSADSTLVVESVNSNVSAIRLAQDQSTGQSAVNGDGVSQNQAQQSAPGQALAEHINNWLSNRLSAQSQDIKYITVTATGALVSNAAKSVSGQQSRTGLPMLNGDGSRFYNNHLLFEKLLSQANPAVVRASTSSNFTNGLSQPPDSNAQGPTPTGTNSPDQAGIATAMDIRPPTPALNNPPSLLNVSTPMQHPNWAQDVGQKLTFMLNQNIQQAHLQMNPRHLGPLEVRISLAHDQQVNVNFVTHNATTRDAIDAAMPRLRDMLGQQGLNLSDFNVSQDNFRNSQGQPQPQDGITSQSYGSYMAADAGDDEGVSLTSHTQWVSDQLVDYFA